MPEYLAPAVYVEEIDSGNKPIEGVSTSTAGMIGVTERGPANVPILVTSYGEYVRWFGERLNRADFGDHCYLPHAVDGFFTNGGKRVYIIERRQAALLARVSSCTIMAAPTRLRRCCCGLLPRAPRPREPRRFMFSTSTARLQPRWTTATASASETTATRSIGSLRPSSRQPARRMCR